MRDSASLNLEAGFRQASLRGADDTDAPPRVPLSVSPDGTTVCTAYSEVCVARADKIDQPDTSRGSDLPGTAVAITVAAPIGTHPSASKRPATPTPWPRSSSRA
ncbi:hypothetical protein [Streptomyces sp. TLI_146]|uniref:hypothetical protein n=1 Tax=Streptomyces sp. TLI_146 TaxID=1938858 RepID=UPI001180E8AC|nr:hypothetical protein [Streptomyces sp. TLI_146]